MLVLLLLVVIYRLHKCIPFWRRPRGCRTHQHLLILESYRKKADCPSVASNSPRCEGIATMVVLGSGGHTTEMLSLLKDIDLSIFCPIHYVVAATDHTSVDRIQANHTGYCFIHRIPRSREVGQPWVSTSFTSLKSVLHASSLVFKCNPTILIVNGPGTCIPVCLWFLFLKFVSSKPRKLLYVESFCRVYELSLTGKILYPFADRFIVQWTELLERYKKSEYIGQLF